MEQQVDTPPPDFETLYGTPLQFHFRPRPHTRRIIIHASRTDSSIRDTVAWLRVRGRQNGLLDIGYHFVIERDGRDFHTRLSTSMGSHAPGCNHDSIGVCLAGDNDLYPTPEQVRSLRILTHALESPALFNRDLPLQGYSEAVRLKSGMKSPGYSMDRLRADIKGKTFIA